MDNNNNQHAITRIETFGVEQIPDHERNATPVDLFRMIFGGANTFATAVLGSFPVLFGLSFQAGLWAILLGVTLGALILAPMGLFGPLNGTNNAVSSGAHFGVHGRIVGSFLSLLTAIAFFSLSVWSSGDAGRRRPAPGRPGRERTEPGPGLRPVRRAGADRMHLRLPLHAAGQQDRRVAASLLFLLGLFASPALRRRLRRQRAARPAGLLGRLHRRHPAGHEQPDLLRRLPGRLGPTSPPDLAGTDHAGGDRRAAGDPGSLPVRPRHRDHRRRPRAGLHRRQQLRRRPAGHRSRLVLPAGMPDRGDRRHVHRHHFAVRHRAGHVQRVPAPARGCRPRC